MPWANSASSTTRPSRFRRRFRNTSTHLSLATELGSKRDSARFAENLALALLKTKQWDKAAEWNDRAAELAKQSGATASLPFLLRNRADIAWGRGQADEAERLSRELLRTNAEQKSITWDAYLLLGQIEAARKRFPQANRDFESAIAIVEGTRSDVLDPRYRVTLLSRMIYIVPRVRGRPCGAAR